MQPFLLSRKRQLLRYLQESVLVIADQPEAQRERFDATLSHLSREQGDAALYAATLSFSAACTIRNVPEKSQLPDIDHSLHQSESRRADAISKPAAMRGMWEISCGSPSLRLSR